MIDRQIDDEELAIGDRVLAEADMCGRTIGFRTVVVKVNQDELWLGLASPDKRLDTIGENQALQLTIARAGAGLLGQSDFIRLLGGGKSRIFAVTRPQALERVQRRAHLRYQIEWPINFRQVDSETHEPGGNASTGTAINVSPGGLLFITEAAPQPGEELSFSLPLAGADRVSAIGVVTRVRGPEDGALVAEGQAPRCEVAVRFIRITALDQDRVFRFILLTEHRRREARLFEPPVSVAPAAPTLQVVPPAADAGATAPTAAPAPPDLPPIDPDLPPIAYGLQLCEQSDTKTVRFWFDGLEPFSRIELLSLLQANMAGNRVAGAPEPASVRPLAAALGLVAG